MVKLWRLQCKWNGCIFCDRTLEKVTFECWFLKQACPSHLKDRFIIIFLFLISSPLISFFIIIKINSLEIDLYWYCINSRIKLSLSFWSTKLVLVRMTHYPAQLHIYIYMREKEREIKELDVELDIRPTNACKAFGGLRKWVWLNIDLSIKTKCAVYRAIVLST